MLKLDRTLRRRAAFLVAVLPVLLLAVACAQADRAADDSEGGESKSPSSAVSAPEAPPEAQDLFTAGSTLPAQDPRRIVRTAELELIVEDTEDAASRVIQLANELGGYVDGLNAHRRQEQIHYEISLRVPAARFEEALSQFRELAIRIDREVQRAEDVTNQIIDLEARLKTLRATEEELRALLNESRERRREVEDIMAIYRHLNEIRTQIEQLEAQRTGLERQVALSTIHLELVPDEASRPIVTDEWRPSETVRSAVRSLAIVLEALVNLGIYLAIVFVPLAVLIGLPIYFWNRRLRRRRRPPEGS